MLSRLQAFIVGPGDRQWPMTWQASGMRTNDLLVAVGCRPTTNTITIRLLWHTFIMILRELKELFRGTNKDCRSSGGYFATFLLRLFLVDRKPLRPRGPSNRWWHLRAEIYHRVFHSSFNANANCQGDNWMPPVSDALGYSKMEIWTNN